MDTKHRITWIDLLRSCAILAVVLCHAVEGIYSLNLEYMSQLSWGSKIFTFLAFTFGRGGGTAIFINFRVSATGSRV